MSQPMSEGAVRLSIDGGIASIVFDRPAARNAMTWAMYEQLGAICERLGRDAGVRVACLRGAGGEAFVAGTDIEQFKHFRDGPAGVDYERRIDEGVARLESLPIPTVAVIQGWAVGGGLALATACDIRIATPSARLGVPIARTLGNCLSMANLARLVAAFGRPRVQRMLIGAEILTAEEGLACGYLAQLLPEGEIDAAAASLCRHLASLAPVTQQVTKEALRRLLLAGLPDAQDLILRSYGSEDFREGVRAFTEKRPPRWRGATTSSRAGAKGAGEAPDLAESAAGEEDPGAAIDMTGSFQARSTQLGQGGGRPSDAQAPMSPGDQAPAGTPGTGEDICPRCGGSGKLPGGAGCPVCQGTGKIVGIDGA